MTIPHLNIGEVFHHPGLVLALALQGKSLWTPEPKSASATVRTPPQNKATATLWLLSCSPVFRETAVFVFTPVNIFRWNHSVCSTLKGRSHWSTERQLLAEQRDRTNWKLRDMSTSMYNKSLAATTKSSCKQRLSQQPAAVDQQQNEPNAWANNSQQHHGKLANHQCRRTVTVPLWLLRTFSTHSTPCVFFEFHYLFSLLILSGLAFYSLQAGGVSHLDFQ